LNKLFSRYIQKSKTERDEKDKECWLCLGKYSSEAMKIVTREISSSPSELAQIVLNILVKIALDEAEFKDLKPEKVYRVERAKK